MILQAADDPICSVDLVRKSDIKENKNMFYLETAVGGHICWLNGNNTDPQPLYGDIVMKFFEDFLPGKQVEGQTVGES